MNDQTLKSQHNYFLRRYYFAAKGFDLKNCNRTLTHDAQITGEIEAPKKTPRNATFCSVNLLAILYILRSSLLAGFRIGHSQIYHEPIGEVLFPRYDEMSDLAFDMGAVVHLGQKGKFSKTGKSYIYQALHPC